MNRTKSLPQARTSVRALAAMTLLDALSGPELVVYLRLVAAVRPRSRVVVVSNAELYKNPRTAVAALRTLEAKKLISVAYDTSTWKRSIGVL